MRFATGRHGCKLERITYNFGNLTVEQRIVGGMHNEWVAMATEAPGGAGSPAMGFASAADGAVHVFNSL